MYTLTAQSYVYTAQSNVYTDCTVHSVSRTEGCLLEGFLIPSRSIRIVIAHESCNQLAQYYIQEE
jgi:hypothetical protein